MKTPCRKKEHYTRRSIFWFECLECKTVQDRTEKAKLCDECKKGKLKRIERPKFD